MASHAAGHGRRGRGGRRMVSKGAAHALLSLGEVQKGGACAEPHGIGGFLDAVPTPGVHNPHPADGGSVEVVDEDCEHHGRVGVTDIGDSGDDDNEEGMMRYLVS